MDKDFREKEMIISKIMMLGNDLSRINWSSKRETNTTITPRTWLMLFIVISGWHVLVLLITDEYEIGIANSSLEFSFYIFLILFGSVALMIGGIYVYKKILDVRRQVKKVIKSPKDIELLSHELQEIKNPKNSVYDVTSLLQEVLIRTKNLEEIITKRADEYQITENNEDSEINKLKEKDNLQQNEINELKKFVHYIIEKETNSVNNQENTEHKKFKDIDE